MDKPHQAMSGVEVLSAHFPIPGAGFLPINAFVIKAREPVLVDTGIRLLDHGVKRSAGTTDLYRRYRLNLSWRELGQMVERARQDLESDRRAYLRRIEWLTPGVVWAMDGTEYDVGLACKIYLGNTRDLGSRYEFCRWPGGIR